MPEILLVDDSEGDRAIVMRLLGKDTSLRVHAAGDGVEALEQIAAAPPDLIVTDLRMPRMDGLELVSQVRFRYPAIPVILMTAHGSESIAIEALAQGAASYVPKVQLPQRLLTTVVDVLGLARANRSHQRLIDCLQRTAFEFELDNDPELIPALVDLVQQMLAGVQLCDANGRVRVAVALEEALLNSLYHGNLEISREQMKLDADGDATPLAELRRNQPPYSDRRIHFAADISTTYARFVVRDEGPGFDLTDIPDPRQPENVERYEGRGLLLMQTFMDEVRYNEAGNIVTMEVNILKPDAPGLSEPPSPKSGTALFRHSLHGDVLVVTPLRGISSFAEEDVQNELAALVNRIGSGEVAHVVVDFSRLTYFGSNMLEALRAIWKRLKESDGRLAVCSLSPVAHEILHLARFDTLFIVADDANAAVDAVRRPQ